MTTNVLKTGDPPPPAHRSPYRDYTRGTTPEEFTRILALLADLKATKDWLEHGDGRDDDWSERIHARARGVETQGRWVEFGWPEPHRYTGADAMEQLAHDSGLVQRVHRDIGQCPLKVWEDRPMHATELHAPAVVNRYLLVAEETPGPHTRDGTAMSWRSNPLIENLPELETLVIGIYRLPPASPHAESRSELTDADLAALGHEKIWLTDRILEEVVFPYETKTPR